MAKRLEKLILFYLGNDVYAFPAVSASKFVEFSKLTPIPNVDKAIKGLIYHNGNLVTIIDLKDRLKIKKSKEDNNSLCLIFEDRDYVYGLLVDKGDETIKVGKTINDSKKKIFRRYFINTDKQKVYILEPEEILQEVNIYD